MKSIKNSSFTYISIQMQNIKIILKLHKSNKLLKKLN